MRQLDGPQMAQQSDPKQTIAFQGAPGAYSDLACRHVFPEMTTLPCLAFEDTFAAVSEDRAALAMNVSSDRKSTRLNSSHDQISYAVFCLKKKKKSILPRHRS